MKLRCGPPKALCKPEDIFQVQSKFLISAFQVPCLSARRIVRIPGGFQIGAELGILGRKPCDLIQKVVAGPAVFPFLHRQAPFLTFRPSSVWWKVQAIV